MCWRCWAEFVQIALDVNVGQVWNTRPPTSNLKTLGSIRLGLRWAAIVRSPLLVRSKFELFSGAAVKHCQNARGDLQVLGLHLPLVVLFLLEGVIPLAVERVPLDGEALHLLIRDSRPVG